MSDQTPNLYVPCDCDNGNVRVGFGGYDQCPKCSSIMFQPATRIEVLEAAGLTATCETCEDGWVDCGTGTFDHACPNCDARGWVLDPDRLEAAAKAIFNESILTDTGMTWEGLTDIQQQGFMDMAKAAVLAYLEPPT